MGKDSFWRKRKPKKSSSAAGGSSGHGDADDVRHDDKESLPPHDGGVDFPTHLKHNNGGIFLHSAEEYHPFSIVTGNDTYLINQISSSGRFLVRTEEYTCSLGRFIAGRRPMETMYRGSNTEHEAPAEWARCLVRGLVDAFYSLGEKTHTALHLLENYIVVIEPDHDKFYNPDLKDDYNPKIEVRIVHKVVDNERETITGEQRRTAILDIIFDVIFQGQNNLWEWHTFARYLHDGFIDYCRNHPCLWHWRDRLLLFVNLWTYISAESDEHATLVSKAISNCHEDELATHTWVQVLEGHKPLKGVHRYHHRNDNDEALTDGVTRSTRYDYVQWDKWVQGVLLIKFLKNCHSHLTEHTWKHKSSHEKFYKNCRGAGVSFNYRKLIHLNHLITYFLYPELIMALHRELLGLGYPF